MIVLKSAHREVGDFAVDVFRDGTVVEADDLGPDGIEEDTSGRRFNELFVRIAEDGLGSVVGVAEQNGLVGGNDLFLMGEENFIRISKDDKALLLVGLFELFHLLLAGRLGEIVATEGDVLVEGRDWLAAGGR